MRLRVVAVATLLATAACGETVLTNPKEFVIAADGSSVVIEGSWKRVTARPTIEVPEVNSFRIECFRQVHVCREYVAKLIRPAHDPGVVENTHLFLMLQEFQIELWDRGRIVAKTEPRAADIFLRVSLTDRTVERESRETEARGALGARTDSDKWILK